jgi:hypothetical protein
MGLMIKHNGMAFGPSRILLSFNKQEYDNDILAYFKGKHTMITVIISLRPNTSISSLDFEDRNTPLLCSGFEIHVTLPGTDLDAAKENALDFFHSEFAISNLDTFDITSTCESHSAHDTLAYEKSGADIIVCDPIAY